MIACDWCEEWFHGACVGITEAEATPEFKYKCTFCRSDASTKRKTPEDDSSYSSLSSSSCSSSSSSRKKLRKKEEKQNKTLRSSSNMKFTDQDLEGFCWNLKTLQKLIAQLKVFKEKGELQVYDSTGMTALHCSAKLNQAPITKRTILI